MGYVHNLNPFLIQFSETFGIRWYGMAYLAGFVAGYFTILRMARRGGTLIREEAIADFITFCAIGVLAGGRLGYCLFYAPELFTNFDGRFPYWGLLRVNEGGMASHGGMIGVMLVCWIYGRVNKVTFLHFMDIVTLGGAIGFFFGRIANFINGELFGREAPAGLSWAVKFPSELLLWLQKDFPKLRSLGPTMDVLKETKMQTGESVPVSSGVWNQWLDVFGRDGVARTRVQDTVDYLIHLSQTGHKEITEALGTVLTPRYPSQLIQAVLEGLIVFLLLCWIWRKPRKPGVIAGWFGALYCIARIIGEQFRMPDPQIGFQLFGLTRGQWLSIVLLAISAVWIFVCQRRSVPAIGGWNAHGADVSTQAGDVAIPSKKKKKR
jgi:phosphatidylglycerol:prolipoprotein diacylglycerol transferase